jgi:hypothetical protein
MSDFPSSLLISNAAIETPRLVVYGTKNMWSFGRDVLLIIVSVYAIPLEAQIKDNIVMEDVLVESRQTQKIVFASHLTDGDTNK